MQKVWIALFKIRGTLRFKSSKNDYPQTRLTIRAKLCMVVHYWNQSVLQEDWWTTVKVRVAARLQLLKKQGCYALLGKWEFARPKIIKKKKERGRRKKEKKKIRKKEQKAERVIYVLSIVAAATLLPLPLSPSSLLQFNRFFVQLIILVLQCL